MRLARITVQGVDDFAVGEQVGDGWIPLGSLGIRARTTRDVIEQWTRIEEAVDVATTSALSDVELGCPLVDPGKILAIGLNYLDHIKETGSERPGAPLVFAKYTSALAGPYQHILHDPSLTQGLDYESELAVVIGRPARRLTADNALDAIFGVAVANDVSARDLQRSDAQFSRSKSFDTFCPIGPWITTATAAGDLQDLAISSTVNGERRQDSNTGYMLFSIRDLLVYLSSTMTLWPGDVILTGTPPGVGVGFNPPVFLRDGDVVECAIEGLGSIRNTVKLDPHSGPAGSTVR
jgi:2-keto-4-pentenoate hydratase/2-oxohepta-3-ene-1,7-dioic acid hydratase in catechol pathway